MRFDPTANLRTRVTDLVVPKVVLIVKVVRVVKSKGLYCHWGTDTDTNISNGNISSI